MWGERVVRVVLVSWLELSVVWRCVGSVGWALWLAFWVVWRRYSAGAAHAREECHGGLARARQLAVVVLVGGRRLGKTEIRKQKQRWRSRAGRLGRCKW